MSVRARSESRMTARNSRSVHVPVRQAVVKVACCVVVAAAFASFPLFANTVIGYAPIIAYVLFLVFSFVYVRVLRRGLAFDMSQAGGECVRGQAVDFDLVVENSSFLPAMRIEVVYFMSDLFGGEGASELHLLTLGPKTSKTFKFAGRFDHIGSYEVGIRRVVVSDLVGLFTAAFENDKLARVNVVPHVYDIVNLPLSTDASLEAKRTFTTVIDDGMDYSSVREYQWGDPIKAIHWKLSSRLPNGEYVTRLYETNANPGMAVIVDFDAPEYTVEELMGIYDTVVECAFSLERYATVHNFDAEFVFQDESKRRMRFFAPFADKRQEALDRMPVIYSPGSGKEALQLVRDEINSTFAQFNLVVCTSVVSPELVQTLIGVRAGKRSPLLIAVIPSTVEEGRRHQMMRHLAQLDNAGVHYHVIADAAELGQG